RRQDLVMVDRVLVMRDQLEIEDAGVRLLGVVGHLIPEIPADLATAAGDVHGDQAWALELEVADPDFAPLLGDVVGILHVDLWLDDDLVGVVRLAEAHQENARRQGPQAHWHESNTPSPGHDLPPSSRAADVRTTRASVDMAFFL